MTTALVTLTKNFAARFGIESNQNELVETLKATAFKGGNVTDAQMTALMLVAQQYSLNPWTREIYAFPDKGGIVPVVGVDGWSRIMNDHPQFDGMDFKFEEDSCTCTIYRKDRSHPTSATEYLGECRRDNSPAWKSHPRRMLRHKAMIQAARLAFGFGGIFDQDEAERIIEVKGDVIEGTTKVVPEKPERKTITLADLKRYTTDKVDADGVVIKLSAKSLIEKQEESAKNLIDFLAAKYILPEEVIKEIQSWERGDLQ